MDENLRKHLLRIQGEPTRAAYQLLRAEAVHHGLAMSYTTGFIPAVKLHDLSNRYLFAFQPAAQHVLFYIRKPALVALPSLHQEAESHHPQARQNPGGETTIRISDSREATRLTEWLFGKLPLPESARGVRSLRRPTSAVRTNLK